MYLIGSENRFTGMCDKVETKGGDKADMPKYPKNHADAEYYVKGRKKRIAGSTVAVKDFLVVLHEENPAFTIRQIRELITDRSRYIPNNEAVEVLDVHIKAGYGDYVPEWK